MSDSVNTQADAELQGAADALIARLQGIAASELSSYQSFLIDFYRLLGIDTPHASADQDYMFERSITFAQGDGSTSTGRINLYHRSALVRESKELRQRTHPKGLNDTMLRARSIAEGYARALPTSEGRPPLQIVVDVSHRIALADLRQPGVRNRLGRVWLDPIGLNPGRESTRLTLEIATWLAKLPRGLENARHAPKVIARFVMRCLFAMFGEDVSAPITPRAPCRAPRADGRDRTAAQGVGRGPSGHDDPCRRGQAERRGGGTAPLPPPSPQRAYAGSRLRQRQLSARHPETPQTSLKQGAGVSAERNAMVQNFSFFMSALSLLMLFLRQFDPLSIVQELSALELIPEWM